MSDPDNPINYYVLVFAPSGENVLEMKIECVLIKKRALFGS